MNNRTSIGVVIENWLSWVFHWVCRYQIRQALMRSSVCSIYTFVPDWNSESAWMPAIGFKVWICRAPTNSHYSDDSYREWQRNKTQFPSFRSDKCWEADQVEMICFTSNQQIIRIIKILFWSLHEVHEFWQPYTRCSNLTYVYAYKGYSRYPTLLHVSSIMQGRAMNM